MRDVLQYFDALASAIEHSGAESADVGFEPTRVDSGAIGGAVYFHDGSRLEFDEMVVVRDRRPARLRYCYQYVRTGEAVFRYDNADHHPGLSSFPHHKHVGRQLLPATAPSLAQVLEEVAQIMEQNNSAKPGLAKRRRQTKRGTRSKGDP